MKCGKSTLRFSDGATLYMITYGSTLPIFFFPLGANMQLNFIIVQIFAFR